MPKKLPTQHLMWMLRSGRTCTFALPQVTCKRKHLGGDGDTGGVSAKGTLMLKSALLSDLGVRVTWSGRFLSISGGRMGLWCTGAIGPINWCHMSPIRYRDPRMGCRRCH
ncbi:hypothetical protein TIFTF001_035609 [Ficus carica]|uniref:Uncharacterized protein n=1 Tax=Ficus carica TaxID=3494 RepID=A0AA88A0Y5_FICCA|nr:hypothetical protein TIFTF001_013445 [Ficus carica]GMN66544.1 hypothetical protein TIFTF001_035609 [Ficus carica]